MFINRQQKPIATFSNLIDSWKVRSIHGFEKYLFPNTQLSTKFIPKYKLINIDPARFIYPRDAMGNMLKPLFNRTTPTSTPFYLPKYDFIKTRSPAWTIRNLHHSKQVIHHAGPTTYNSVNDKSQLPCKSGWTLTERRPKAQKLPVVNKRRFSYDTQDHKANDLITSDDHVVNVKAIDLSLPELSMKTDQRNHRKNFRLQVTGQQMAL